jgi:RNA polymerase sigma-70 factor (ECF subfamily)
MTRILDFWQEHKARLRGFIAKRVGSGDAVDDIMQEVYLKAHASLHTVRSSGSLAAWLFRVASNAIADHYRKQKPWAELPADLASPEPEHDYVAEVAACLQPLIAKLPKSYQDALTLSELEGLPQREVANRLGVSLSGAKSRVQRGREKLRRQLVECCDIETGRGGIVDCQPRHKNRECGCV